mgnify:CR=1 FL=1
MSRPKGSKNKPIIQTTEPVEKSKEEALKEIRESNTQAESTPIIAN